jgi:hypothetical protein
MPIIPPVRCWLSKTIISTNILVLAVTSLTACTSLLASTHGAAGACVVEIDVSTSVRHAGLVDSRWFLPFVGQVAGGCRRQSIDAGLVGRNSQAGTCPRWHLPAAALNGNPINDQAVEISRRGELRRGLKGLLSCGLRHQAQTNGTDLFGAFMYAGSVAGSHLNAHVYVLSDMMEYQGQWNFYKRRFDASANRILLTQIKKAGLIPSGLDHSNVTVFGMDAGALSISPASLAGMQRFWHAYFAAAGASFDVAGNGA